MKFIPCRRVDAPVLDVEMIRAIAEWKSVETSLPLEEGDCFSVVYRGEMLPVFCSSSVDRTVLRRMRPEEIAYSAMNGGDTPLREGSTGPGQ